MPKHMYVLIFTTFLLGMAAGVYGFLMTRDAVVWKTTPDAPQVRGFEISAYTYGGCEHLGCSTYRIGDDGTYTYRGNSESERREGTLPQEAKDALTRTLLDTPLSSVSESPFTGECPTYVDGLGYRYEIRRGSETYRVDSCVHNLDGPLFTMLEEYFTVFGDSEGIGE